jgi:hypothetical protein
MGKQMPLNETRKSLVFTVKFKTSVKYSSESANLIFEYEFRIQSPDEKFQTRDKIFKL